MNILEHHPLAPLTTLRVGGSARYFATAQETSDLYEGFAFARAKNISTVVLGGGSNTLFDDGEAEALFLHPQYSGIEVDGETLIVSSGTSWDATVMRAVDEGLYGLENLSGIPGSLGGAVVQNIGAYGAALSQYVVWVEAFDTHEERITRLTADACAFGYRDSLFKQQAGRYVIIRAALALSRTGKLNCSYRDLAEVYIDRTPTLSGVRNAVLSIRAGKFPDLTQEGSAGSFFKNPVVGPEEGARLQALYPALPLFPLPEAAGYKVPLAWILDHVLSLRGFSIGNVRCFERQPLVLATKAGATAKEVRALAYEVTKRVRAETHMSIEPEVCVMRGAFIAHALDF